MHSVAEGETLVNQGEPGTDVYLILDGIFVVEVDGEQVAEVGPGGGRRRAGRPRRRQADRDAPAQTPARVAGVPADALDVGALGSLADSIGERGSRLATILDDEDQQAGTLTADELAALVGDGLERIAQLDGDRRHHSGRGRPIRAR